MLQCAHRLPGIPGSSPVVAPNSSTYFFIVEKKKERREKKAMKSVQGGKKSGKSTKKSASRTGKKLAFVAHTAEGTNKQVARLLSPDCSLAKCAQGKSGTTTVSEEKGRDDHDPLGRQGHVWTFRR